MIVNFPLLLIGLLLLWFPRRWLRLGAFNLGRRRRRASSGTVVEPWRSREPGDPRVSFAVEFTKFRNYLDLLRAATGGLVMTGALGFPAGLAAAPDAPRNVVLQITIVRVVVFGIGVLIQTVRYEKQRFSFYPPIFYLAGLSAALCEPRSAACAFALAWAFNLGLPHAQAFLTVYSLLLFVFPVVFARRIGVWPAFAGVITFLPVLLSLLAKKPLTILSRRPPRPAPPT